MSNDTNAVDSKKRAAAVLLVIRFRPDLEKRVLGKIRTDFANRCSHKLVFKPLEDRDRNRFACFQNHVTDKTIADDDLDRFFKKMTAFNVADEIKGASLQQFENLLSQLGAFDIFITERDQADSRVLVM